MSASVFRAFADFLRIFKHDHGSFSSRVHNPLGEDVVLCPGDMQSCNEEGGLLPCWLEGVTVWLVDRHFVVFGAESVTSIK